MYLEFWVPVNLKKWIERAFINTCETFYGLALIQTLPCAGKKFVNTSLETIFAREDDNGIG